MMKLEQPPLRQRRKLDTSRAFPQKELEQYLENCGHTYIDVRPLEKLAYTNGITYTFEKGENFTCRKENDIESNIFNSNLKKLGASGSNNVVLKIKTAVPTRPATNPKTSGWIERRAQSDSRKACQNFNTIKIRASIDAADDGIEVHENCGVVPVFTHAAPSSQVSHYAIEMKAMRDKLIAANKIMIESLSGWFDLEYPSGGGREHDWTTDHDQVLALYQIQITDGAIRNKRTGQILTSKIPTLHGMINGKGIQVSISRHRAYMFSCMRHTKRGHQTDIDHIDGDHANNEPWNLRWVSKAENMLAKHCEMSERVVPDRETLVEKHGMPDDPKEWEGTGWTFHSNKWITRQDKSEFIARLNPDRKTHYPVIGATVEDNGETKFRLINCHLIVAYLYRIPPSPLASAHLETLGKSRAHFFTYGSTYFEYIAELKKCGLVIMHGDDDKANYSANNLRIGTRSENQTARHENPATTFRKRVNIIDPMDGKRIETVESQSKAAEWFGIKNAAISKAVRRNMTREIGTYMTTKNKKTGAKYVVVAV